VRRALALTEIEPAELIVPWTGVRFDDNGQNTGVRVVVVQHQGGGDHTVWPFELATREVIYPLPGRAPTR
jgi:branched-chain amino acid transport system substrate-binding protein